METRPSRLLVALVSLLVFLLTGQVGVQGYVWCLGEDGHAALEYAASSGCGQDAQSPGLGSCKAEALESTAREEHCGPCLDIPASFEATSGRTQSHKASPLQARFPAIVQTSPRPAFVQVLAVNRYPQPPPRISQAILAHRTVVLLN